MRSAVNGHVKMAKVSVESPIQLYGDRDLFMQRPKSKSACLHRHGVREKSGILNINTPVFYILHKNRLN